MPFTQPEVFEHHTPLPLEHSEAYAMFNWLNKGVPTMAEKILNQQKEIDDLKASVALLMEENLKELRTELQEERMRRMQEKAALKAEQKREVSSMQAIIDDLKEENVELHGKLRFFNLD